MKSPRAPTAMVGRTVVYHGTFYTDLIGKRVTVDMVSSRRPRGRSASGNHENFICSYRGAHGMGGCTMDWKDVEPIAERVPLPLKFS